MTTHFRKIWKLWQLILLSVRAAHKISKEEIDQLNIDVQSFCVAYTENTKGSITIKMHILTAHFAEKLRFMGLLGYSIKIH